VNKTNPKSKLFYFILSYLLVPTSDQCSISTNTTPNQTKQKQTGGDHAFIERWNLFILLIGFVYVGYLYHKIFGRYPSLHPSTEVSEQDGRIIAQNVRGFEFISAGWRHNTQALISLLLLLLMLCVALRCVDMYCVPLYRTVLLRVDRN